MISRARSRLVVPQRASAVSAKPSSWKAPVTDTPTNTARHAAACEPNTAPQRSAAADSTPIAPPTRGNADGAQAKLERAITRFPTGTRVKNATAARSTPNSVGPDSELVTVMHYPNRTRDILDRHCTRCARTSAAVHSIEQTHVPASERQCAGLAND